MATRTSDGFLTNGTKVKFMLRKFNKDTRKVENVGIVEGIIVDGDYNICTFEKSYDVEFTHPEHGRTFTSLGIAEKKLTIL